MGLLINYIIQLTNYRRFNLHCSANLKKKQHRLACSQPVTIIEFNHLWKPVLSSHTSTYRFITKTKTGMKAYCIPDKSQKHLTMQYSLWGISSALYTLSEKTAGRSITPEGCNKFLKQSFEIITVYTFDNKTLQCL